MASIHGVTFRAFVVEAGFPGGSAPKGLRLAGATVDGAILWWPGTEAPPTELKWAGAHIAVTFSPDGRYLMTAMQENALHGWRIEDAQDMRMSGYAAKPKSMSWS